MGHLGNPGKDIYAELEMIYINQHSKIRTINVKPDERMTPLIGDDQRGLTKELEEFKRQFSFHY